MNGTESGYPLFGGTFQYPEGETTGWHGHSEHQLVHAVEGVMTVESSNGLWVVPPYRAVWIPAGISHQVTMNTDVAMRTAYLGDGISGRGWKECFVLAVSPLLRELLVKAAALSERDSKTRRAKLLGELILEELREVEAMPLYLPQPRDRRLCHITDALLENTTMSLTFAQLAKGSGSSERNLARLFKNETGLSFGQWRQQLVLLRALEMLASGKDVLNVALELGYSSPSAFSQMFRRAFGVAPSRYFRRP